MIALIVVMVISEGIFTFLSCKNVLDVKNRFLGNNFYYRIILIKWDEIERVFNDLLTIGIIFPGGKVLGYLKGVTIDSLSVVFLEIYKESLPVVTFRK